MVDINKFANYSSKSYFYGKSYESLFMNSNSSTQKYSDFLNSITLIKRNKSPKIRDTFCEILNTKSKTMLLAQQKRTANFYPIKMSINERNCNDLLKQSSSPIKKLHWLNKKQLNNTSYDALMRDKCQYIKYSEPTQQSLLKDTRGKSKLNVIRVASKVNSYKRYLFS